jgi:2-polyprenyl-6-methoxyphenol hydroxylase-like FAD-dependent oxidoreductase
VSAAQRVPILVAGGGIGGLAVALALANRGLGVRVIEKATEFGELGAGLQLAPNASRALDALGVRSAIESFAVFPQRMIWMDAISGEEVTSLDLAGPFRERYGYRYIVMHRSDLLAVLLEACRANARITLETSKDVLTVEDRIETARVTCADGSTYEADVLIGADGLWSTVRKVLVDDGEPICSEYVAYRGAIPIEQMSSHAGLDNVMLWTGPNMHLVQYPVRRGELYNQVAVFRSDRYRADSDDWGTSDELDAHFGAGTQAVRAALTKLRRNRRWPMYDRLPIPRWSRHRITLLGDAAHPMLQYLAQGAAQALEDAVALGDALADHPGDVGKAFAAYEGTRVPRTALVQTKARAWGDYWHMPLENASLRNTRLATRNPHDYSETDWLYAHGTEPGVRAVSSTPSRNEDR